MGRVEVHEYGPGQNTKLKNVEKYILISVKKCRTNSHWPFYGVYGHPVSLPWICHWTSIYNKLLYIIFPYFQITEETVKMESPPQKKSGVLCCSPLQPPWPNADLGSASSTKQKLRYFYKYHYFTSSRGKDTERQSERLSTKSGMAKRPVFLVNATIIIYYLLLLLSLSSSSFLQ